MTSIDKAAIIWSISIVAIGVGFAGFGSTITTDVLQTPVTETARVGIIQQQSASVQEMITDDKDSKLILIQIDTIFDFAEKNEKAIDSKTIETLKSSYKQIESGKYDEKTFVKTKQFVTEIIEKYKINLVQTDATLDVEETLDDYKYELLNEQSLMKIEQQELNNYVENILMSIEKKTTEHLSDYDMAYFQGSSKTYESILGNPEYPVLLEKILSERALTEEEIGSFIGHIEEIMGWHDVQFTPKLTVTPNGGPYNTPIKIEGSGFKPLTEVSVRISHHNLEPVVTSISGWFQLETEFPSSISEVTDVVVFAHYGTGNVHTFFTSVPHQEISILSGQDFNNVHTISGKNFPFSSTVYIYVDDEQIQSARTSSNGEFSIDLDLSSFTSDSCTTTIHAKHGDLISAFSHTMINDETPRVYIASSSVKPANNFFISGENFKPSCNVMMEQFDPEDSEMEDAVNSWQITPDNSGEFQQSLTASKGTWNFVVTSAGVPLLILEVPVYSNSLWSAPQSVAPGTPILLFGYNYPPSVTMPVTFNISGTQEELYLTDVTTNSEGEFYIILDAPDAGSPKLGFFKVGGDAVYSNTKAFWNPEIQPTVELSASSGTPGSKITITGSNFPENESDTDVMVSFGISQHTVTFEDIGLEHYEVSGENFEIEFTIPAGAPAGDNVLVVASNPESSTDKPVGMAFSFQVN